MKVYKLTYEEVKELLSMLNKDLEIEELNKNDPFIKVNKEVIEKAINTIASIIGRNIYENESKVLAVLKEKDLNNILDVLEKLKGELIWI